MSSRDDNDQARDDNDEASPQNVSPSLTPSSSRIKPGISTARPGPQQILKQTFTGQWQQLKNNVYSEYIWQLKQNQLILKKQVGNDNALSIMAIFKDVGPSDIVYFCGDDTYQANITINNNKAILSWDIQGPKKDIKIVIKMF